MKEIEVVNYYDENGSTVSIPLNPMKTPSENAQKYFSKYQKAKNAVQIVQEQIEKARDEVIYFDSGLCNKLKQLHQKILRKFAKN